MPRRSDLFRWQWERLTRKLPPNPRPSDLPPAISRVSYPRGDSSELRATWVGHSTWLLQLGGLNLLTDPQWSDRASPFRSAGPRRFTPPGVPFDKLPEIDAVLLSHDHFDHLDIPTLRRLRDGVGRDAIWLTPLGYQKWFEQHGIRPVELDWWGSTEITIRNERLSVTCLPAQHWAARSVIRGMTRLWCSWAAASPTHNVYFGGDSGWFPEYPEIGRRAGPFDLSLLPIGAYDPPWFMRASHMNPEEAVRAYKEMGGSGAMAGMHWGTFRLTDEDPLEPPERARAAWSAEGLPPLNLWLPHHGETRIWPAPPTSIPD